MDITLRINGATYTGSPEARKTLADFLRDDLNLTGTQAAACARLHKAFPRKRLAPSKVSAKASASAAAGALWLESEYAAESAVDVVHQGCRQVAGGCLKVGLVEGDQGSDVDH